MTIMVVARRDRLEGAIGIAVSLLRAAFHCWMVDFDCL
jgi:hypothetical protein